MVNENREVITNGAPALEQLSKEEADLFYRVLLSQVQITQKRSSVITDKRSL